MSDTPQEMRCFHDGSRRCTSVCMAYEDDNGKPACTLMLAASSIVGFLMGMDKAQRAAAVRYPTSPPPPEVR